MVALSTGVRAVIHTGVRAVGTARLWTANKIPVPGPQVAELHEDNQELSHSSI